MASRSLVLGWSVVPKTIEKLKKSLTQTILCDPWEPLPWQAPENIYALGPAKTYIFRGAQRTYAIKPGDCDRQLDNEKAPVSGTAL